MYRRQTKVELFEQLRREYKYGVGTIKGVALKFGVHRRMVREAIDSAVPKPRKEAKRKRAKMAPVIPGSRRFWCPTRKPIASTGTPRTESGAA